MFTIMPAPVFPPESSSSSSSSAHYHRRRPRVSSPLSSPPRAPRDSNAGPPRRDVQSSPIQAAKSTSAPRPRPQFQFASRPARPNPLVKRRDDAQAGRRNLFLRNVRQRADDRRWEQRGGENELLKLEWFSLDRELKQAKMADLQGVVSEAEIEDAARLRDEEMQASLDPDDMMVDAMAQQEQAEIEALLSSMPPSWDDAHSSQPPQPPALSDDDDEDYDAIFAEYMAGQGNGQPSMPQDMDMS